MEMQQRIDALIQMRREKPEHKNQWEKLQHALLTEATLLTTEQAEHLQTEFRSIRQEELLKLWDERFHEVLITGKMTDEYSEYSVAFDRQGFGRPVPATAPSFSSQASFASLTLGDESLDEYDIKEMKKAVADYKAMKGAK